MWHGQVTRVAPRTPRGERNRWASTGPPACSRARRDGTAAGPAVRGRDHRVGVRCGGSSRRRHGTSIFSNAALHWVDGHERLIARQAAALAPFGTARLPGTGPARCVDSPRAQELRPRGRSPSAFGAWRRSQPVLNPTPTRVCSIVTASPHPKVRLIGPIMFWLPAKTSWSGSKARC